LDERPEIDRVSHRHRMHAPVLNRRDGTVACWIAAVVALSLNMPVLTRAQSASDGENISAREQLARDAQNPLANRISVTILNNANFDLGPQNGTLDVVNIQAVVPIRVNEDWHIITRTVVPVVSQPVFPSGSGTIQGFSFTQVSFFASPARLVDGMILGAGPIVQLPTTTNSILGSIRWGAGPAAAALMIRGPWVVGGLVNNVWTFADNSPAARNIMTLQPILNYNFASGTYLASAPMVRASWEVIPRNRWIVPVGGGVGQIFRSGAQPVNALLAAYYNVVRPTVGPVWQLRGQLQLLF
jgi:hypothetical protein